MRYPFYTLAIPFVFWFCCCSTDKEEIAFGDENEMTSIGDGNEMISTGDGDEMISTNDSLPTVTMVDFSGDANAYTFDVTIASPDTGCMQYADWWEVIDGDGDLLYRRILTHSHVDEQPFTRSGGAVQISDTTEVYVRAHMNNLGYGSSVQKGSITDGFSSSELDVDFASELQEEAPLPDGCAF